MIDELKANIQQKEGIPESNYLFFILQYVAAAGNTR